MPTTTTRRLISAGVAGLLLAALPSCGLFGGDDDDSTPTTAATTSTTTPPPPATELLDPGREPRRPLRFAFQDEQISLRTVVDLGVFQTVDGSSIALDTPAVHQTVRLTTSPAADGGADVTIEVEALTLGDDASAEEREALEADLTALVGLRGSGHIDDRGRVTSFAYDLDGEVPADLQPVVAGFGDQLEALVAPLPEEAVGAGARWRSTTSTVVGGTAVPITTVYEIAAFEGDEVRYSSTGEGAASDRPLDDAGFPDGTTAHLVTSRTTSRGSGTMSLRSLAASAVAHADSTQTIRVDGPDGTSTVEQRTVVDLVAAPVTPDGG